MNELVNVGSSKSGHAIMRARARLISLIGDELISDEPVALVELVKNAYDADAKTVRVAFSGQDVLDPDTLTVVDDGCGMTLQTVLGAWLEPGTVIKKRQERSPGGRLYQGAKGIGRFAAARLAQSLYMETRSLDEEEGVTVLLEWGKFNDESYLDEVSIDYEVRPLPERKHGTALTLINLHARKHWTEEDFKTLHNRLSRLISPFQNKRGAAEVSDFEIDLQIPAFPAYTGKVEPHGLTRAPKYRLKGKLSAKGLFNGSLDIDGKKSKAFKNVSLGAKGESVACGPFEVEIRAWDRDRPGLTPYMMKFDLSMKGLRDVLDDYSGVSIYRDGFRVHPYGERGFDWLSLDTRSRQNPTLRLANNQVIAAIRISREDNPDLIDRATREGFVHNHSYEALQEWFKRILAPLETERYAMRPRDEARPEEMSTLFEAFDMSEVVKEADERLGKKHPVAALVRKKDVDIREGVQRLQEHYSRMLMAAGLGQLVDVVIHEIGAPLGRANRALSDLEKAMVKMWGGPLDEEVTERFTTLRAWLEQIYNLRERLIPKSAGRRGRTSSFSVQEEIQGNLELYSSLIAKQSVKVLRRWPNEPVIVHMSRSNLGQIIANLLDNSIYWLTRHHGDGKGGSIEIRLTELKHGFRILFADDGPGIPPEDRDRVFDAEFSRKPHGMGLGLFIARQVIEMYGKLIYRDDGPLSGACFEASFEQRVGL
jgi:signal transduction histidine kinase